MKRILSALLCVALLVGLFAGCGKDGVKKGDGSTITIGICTNALVEDYDNNALTKWLEEQSGYNIEFTYFSSNSNDAKSQIATMMAGGETLPDIIWGVELGRDVYTEYGTDGYFVDLKPYFDDKEKSKIFWDRFENEISKNEQDSYMRQMKDPETEAIYAFPRIETSDIDIMDYTLYINQKWLKKLNLEVPKSMDELYKVLQAFRDKDPNGNGQKDEIPLIGANSSLGGSVVDYIVNQYLYYNPNRVFGLKDGKITTPFTTNEYRDALKYANKLVKEGLLSSMSLTVGAKELKAMICPTVDADGKISDDQELVGCFAGHLTLEVENDNPAILDYVPLDYWSSCVLEDNLHSLDTYITEDCQNKDAAWNLLMTMFTKEASLRMRYGEKGVDWKEADNGTKSYIGRDAEIKVINNVWGSQNSSVWCRIGSTMLIDAENEVTQVEDATEWMTYRNKIFGQAHDNYMAAAEKYNPKELLPKLSYTTEEKEQYDMTMSNINNLISTSRSSFVTGTMDPNKDSDWNSYVKQLDDLGLKDYVALTQKAYDRQKQ